MIRRARKWRIRPLSRRPAGARQPNARMSAAAEGTVTVTAPSTDGPCTGCGRARWQRQGASLAAGRARARGSSRRNSRSCRRTGGPRRLFHGTVTVTVLPRWTVTVPPAGVPSRRPQPIGVNSRPVPGPFPSRQLLGNARRFGKTQFKSGAHPEWRARCLADARRCRYLL